jgi:hypothetical protein
MALIAAGQGGCGRGGPFVAAPIRRSDVRRRIEAHLGEVAGEHDPDELGKGRPGLPAEPLAGLRGVAAQLVDLGRAEIAGVDLDVVLPVEPDEPEGLLDELPDRVHLARGHDVVVRLGLLEHQPHRLDVLGREAPVAAGVEVAEVELGLGAGEDRRDPAGDLPRHERGAATWRLVVEQDAVRRVEVVCLAVLDGHPVGEDLRHGIRTARIERRPLRLRPLPDHPVHLARPGLVEPDRVVEMANRFEQPERSHARCVGRELGHVEADLDVTLGTEVVDLVRADAVQGRDERRRIGQVRVVEEQPDVLVMRVAVEMLDPAGREAAGAPDEPVDLIALA